MKKYLILFLAITLLSCSSNDEDGVVNIRLSNGSIYDYENVVVNTSTGRVTYGNLASGEVTDYKSFEKAYRYALVELSIDGEVFTLQPIDYVGEKHLEHGNYTYELRIDDSQDQYKRIILTLVEE